MRKWIAALLLLLVGTTLAACSATDKNSKTDMTSISTSLVTMTPTPTSTPVPTYAPGTKLYGMINVTGDVVVDPQYEYLDLFSDEGLARFEDHGLWGFVDETGAEIIEPQYTEALSFSDGLAAVLVGGLYGFIDTTGEMVIEPQYLGVGDGFHFGRCTFTENEMQGLIDKNGDIILDAKYKSIILKCEKYFIVENMQNEFGIIDRDGKIIVECQYPEIYSVVDSGYYFVPSSDSEDNNYMYNLEGNKRYIFPNIYTNSDYPIYATKPDSLVNVSSEASGKWGLFDLATGEFVIEPIYDSAWYYPGNRYVFISLDDYWGVADASTGQIILDCINKKCNKHVDFDYIVYEGENDHWGVMNLDGTSVLPAEYEQIVCSPNGEFGVVKNNKSFLLDAEGNTIKELSDSVIEAYVPSIKGWIYTNDYEVEYVPTYGILNRDGSVLMEPSFELYFAGFSGYPYFYPNPIDYSITPVIIDLRFAVDSGGIATYAIVNNQGYSVDSLYSDFEYFPDQNVLVVTDEKYNSGLVSFDGTVLFELQFCQFLINEGGYHDNDENLLFYDKYNDTDYLIFFVWSK